MIDLKSGSGISKPLGNYVLISAARNEEKYIERTIQAVVAQSYLPAKWVILNDGSTDLTETIVQEYALKQPFIQLIRIRPESERNFGSKARAINFGYKQIKATSYEFVGILDVDVTFDHDYYEKVIHHMENHPDLGIAGGILSDLWKGRFIRQITATRWSVSGPIQLFRRPCWEQIGGYMNIRGGIDAAAEVMARMNGWRVESLKGLPVLHFRRTGTEKRGVFMCNFYRGIEDYAMGYHPVFFISRSLLRVSEQPRVLGSLFMLVGYLWACVRREKRKVSDDFVRFLRHEQMGRLARLLKRNKVESA